MQANVFIKEKLSEQHESFLKYCQEAGKKFVDELDREDFIAYRSEYAVSREQVEHIKILLNFQEQESVEKISPPQNIFDDSEVILQDYFKITDLAPYENILISELDFNVRVHNCLSFNGYRTLAELLKSSRQKLSGLKNFGQGSFDNLIATLKKFLTPRKKKIPAEALRLANEELDEFLRNAALNHAPQIDLIILALKKFSDSVTIKNAFRDLPEEFKDKRVRPFLLACDLENADFFAALPHNFMLAELPEYLAENSIEFDADKLKKFVDALRFDVRACAKKIFVPLFKDKRKFNVVYRRAKGDTLEDIGKNFCVTRERIRQIEAKSVCRFKNHHSDTKKIFYFLHALTDGKCGNALVLRRQNKFVKWHFSFRRGTQCFCLC